MWLKPGKKYLFGRATNAGLRCVIDHRTVSRKHFIITVDAASDEIVGQIHTKTKITITDISSKSGTTINGARISHESLELKDAVTSIRPGTCPHELVISWIPCILTFSLTKKEIKNGQLKAKQDRVKELDIKAVNEYLTGQTTHLVAQKRNTAKGLQALIEAKPIITEAYIDALIYASTPVDLQEEENLCPLEIDFDEAWPDAATCLPPAGKEPTTKPDEAYTPDPARAKVFDKYIFIFFEQSQYDSLLPPITTGHGKAVFFNATPNSSTVEQGLTFVRKSAGNSGRWILVKPNEDDDAKSWLGEYVEELCSELDVEPASQSDFLDAVLANDASQLRKPQNQSKSAGNENSSNTNKSNQVAATNRVTELTRPGSNPAVRLRHDSTKSSLSSPPLSRSASAAPETESVPEATQQSPTQDDNPRPRKRVRTVPSKRAVTGFDDEFDPDAIAAYEDEPAPVQTRTRLPIAVNVQDEDSEVSIKEEPAPQNKRQRATEPIAEASDHELDDLLPAAAAMRKEKQRSEAEARAKGLPIKSAISQPRANAAAKPKKEVKLLDVREAVRVQRAAEEAASKKQQQELEDLYAEDAETKGPANLAVIKDFDLPVRKKIGEGQNGYRGETWKPEWEGRKNFKGFRRARDLARNGDGSRRPKDKIIVPLVQVEKNSYGIGEQYWPRGEEENNRAERVRGRKKGSQAAFTDKTQGVSRHQRSQTVESESESDENSGAEDEAGQISPETARLQKEAEGVLEHPIDVDAPRQTRHGETQSQASKNSTAPSRSSKGVKRNASSTPTGSSTTKKKQKTLPTSTREDSGGSEEDDDSDDMKFKFGRGRRVRAAK